MYLFLTADVLSGASASLALSVPKTTRSRAVLQPSITDSQVITGGDGFVTSPEPEGADV